MKFDLRDIRGAVAKAGIDLYTISKTSSNFVHDLYVSNDNNWNEEDANYNTGIQDDIGSSIANWDQNDIILNDWNTTDITTAVNDALAAGNDYLTLVIKSNQSGGVVQFASNGNDDESLWPKLKLKMD